MRGQIESNTTAIWRQTAALVSQFDGLVVGYNSVAAPGENMTAMHFLEVCRVGVGAGVFVAIILSFSFTMRVTLQVNSIGDLLDLITALFPRGEKFWASFKSPADIMRQVHRDGHCSALVKITGNYSEIFMVCHDAPRDWAGMRACVAGAL